MHVNGLETAKEEFFYILDRRQPAVGEGVGGKQGRAFIRECEDVHVHMCDCEGLRVCAWV